MHTKEPSIRSSETFECPCGSEALVAEKYSDEEEIYLSIWFRGVGAAKPLDWKGRLRYCWRILTKGSPYGDQLILTPETAVRLSNFLKVDNKQV